MTGDKKRRASIKGAMSFFLAVALVISGIMYLTLPLPCLSVRVQPEGELLYRERVRVGDTFTYHYVHSVEQTLVCERYRIGDDYRLLLTGTETGSLGAGLPYGADGRFALGDGTFVYAGLEKPVEVLRLKPTAFTQCGLDFGNHRLNLNRPELSGRPVEVRVETTGRFTAWG